MNCLNVRIKGNISRRESRGNVCVCSSWLCELSGMCGLTGCELCGVYCIHTYICSGAESNLPGISAMFIIYYLTFFSLEFMFCERHFHMTKQDIKRGLQLRLILWKIRQDTYSNTAEFQIWQCSNWMAVCSNYDIKSKFDTFVVTLISCYQHL